MTTQEQDKALANDILKRNWYPFLQDGTKQIELIVDRALYHIECAHCYELKFKEEDKPYNPHEQFLQFLNWYIENNLISEVIIDGIHDMAELIFYIDRAPSTMVLHFPLNIQLYLSNKDNSIWQKENCQYHFNCDVTDNLQWELIDKPCRIYFDDGVKALELYNHIHNNKIFTWKYQLPPELNELGAYQLYQFILQYYTDMKNNLSEEEFVQWVMGKTIPICPLPIAYNKTFRNQDKIACNMQDRLTIDLTTMGLYLCPVLDNIEFRIGTFDFSSKYNLEPHIVELMVAKDHIRQGICIGCANCYLKGICNKACLGQGYYESSLLGTVGSDFDTHDNLHKLYVAIILLLKEWNILDKINTDEEEFGRYLDQLVKLGETYGYKY